MSDANIQPADYEDPYEGYASCPDTKRIYISHSKENQLLWMTKSEETIREFISQVPSLNNFHEAYSFLAKKRHQIALDLKQRHEDSRMDLYGILRREGDHYRQSVSSGDGEHFWKWQKNKIFELTYNLIESVKTVTIFNMQPGFFYEDKFMTCLKEKVVVDDKNATYYCISIKFPSTEMIKENIIHSPILSQIELYDFDINRKFNLIRIEYTPIDNRNTPGHFLLADHYYQAMINWKQEDGLENFLSNAAKLAYLSAHILPVKHGNSAIIEWMLRGIAFRNGINLGRFNYAEGISWDFKALLTPDMNEYVKWFSEKLFTHPTLISQPTVLPDFTFNQDKN